jgi:hypothetical protein
MEFPIFRVSSDLASIKSKSQSREVVIRFKLEILAAPQIAEIITPEPLVV